MPSKIVQYFLNTWEPILQQKGTEADKFQASALLYQSQMQDLEQRNHVDSPIPSLSPRVLG